MTETPTPDTPITLWLTDRSRWKTSGGRCRRKRYLGYHAGPTGYGYTHKSDSLPLATGSAVHSALSALATILQRERRLPTEAETRAIVLETQTAYVAKVAAKGFQGILGGPTTDETIAEQRALISGLVWALRLRFLPWFHEGYEVVEIEQERLHLLHCACGAGPMAADEHIRRGCTGRALMIRTDLLAKRRGAPTLAYFECKTTGWESDAWSEKWETDPQLALGTLDLDQRYGAEVTELYIIGLGKGARKRDYNDPEGRKKQQTALCYGYCAPANPPLSQDDWVPAYEWTTDDGEIRRKSKRHVRRGIWELPQSDWAVWTAYHGQDPTMPPEEFWVRFLPTSLLDKVCFVLGPMNRQDPQLASVLRGMDADEVSWQQVLWELYEAQQAGAAWASDEFQTLLDRLAPCSWECRPFGREYECEFAALCHRREGWQDPIGSGLFVPRRPHHAPELAQAVARGLLEAEAQDVEEDDER